MAFKAIPNKLVVPMFLATIVLISSLLYMASASKNTPVARFMKWWEHFEDGSDKKWWEPYADQQQEYEGYEDYEAEEEEQDNVEELVNAPTGCSR